ncbi:serine/threonine-protein kinase chk-1-like [Oratosquilla oratoria]|uniref:serine/threonine-protein kinase chk-1-like n=1 Tax=Oratosquilla oratoria TaxID=337810 RepID=UPI003F75BB70
MRSRSSRKNKERTEEEEGGRSRRSLEATEVEDIVKDCSLVTKVFYIYYFQDEVRKLKFEDNGVQLEGNTRKVNQCQQIVLDLFKTLPGQRSDVDSTPKNKRKFSSEDEEELTVRKKAKSHSSTWIDLRELGQGSFGLVTLVKEIDSGRLAARKSVDSNNKNDRNEILIHESLRHRNIIELMFVEVLDSSINIYLEYASEGDLGDHIGPNGMGEFTALFFFVQLVEGVEYLHSQGIAHRDLKPDNLLVTEDRVLKIADFGLSASFIVNDEEIFLNRKCGTPHYRAPEVCSGRYRGQPADVWSCGVTLYALLTGSTPWTLACPEDPHYNKFLRNTGTWPSGCSRQASGLILHMLKPIPEERATIAQIKENPWLKC